MQYLPGRAPGANWRAMRGLVREQQPLLTGPRPGVPGLCDVCRGAAAPRTARCFQCDLHRQCAHGTLADVVVPVAFAVKGSPHARHLWQYKSPRADPEIAARAAAMLLALLLVFLREHGRCVWRAAGMSDPSHLAVVPTARGRPGAHPLRRLITPYLSLPWADLTACPDRGRPERDLDPDRFRAAAIPGSAVLLVDDTWTTGSSAQSAAMALRRAGARKVATVVLGRHLGSAAPWPGQAVPAALAFRPESCAAHDASMSAADRRLW